MAAGAHGSAHRRGAAARRGELRRAGDHPLRPAAGLRPRRPGRAVPTAAALVADDSRRVAWSTWARCGCVIFPGRSSLAGGRRASGGVPAAAVAGSRRTTCRGADVVRRPRGGAGGGRRSCSRGAAGDADRLGRLRQDPAGAARRRRSGRRTIRWGVVGRAGPGVDRGDAVAEQSGVGGRGATRSGRRPDRRAGAATRDVAARWSSSTTPSTSSMRWRGLVERLFAPARMCGCWSPAASRSASGVRWCGGCRH